MILRVFIGLSAGIPVLKQFGTCSSLAAVWQTLQEMPELGLWGLFVAIVVAGDAALEAVLALFRRAPSSAPAAPVQTHHQHHPRKR
jgi:ABC-type proline/glycine betaine transport system permease subunit